MNHIRSQRPEDTPATYTFGAPLWLVLAFRGVLLLAGCATAVLSAQHWQAMPLQARVLAALLIPALLAWSIWSAPWQQTTQFIANEEGMHFPVYPPLTLSARMQRPEAWLAVPWAHISDIRLAREVGEDGTCVAFDVLVASEEESRFFEAVGTPRDRQVRLPTLVFAAYGGWHPSPTHAMAHLQRLSLRGQA